LKSQWCGVKEVFERPDIVEERHRIDVDCRRTDRSQPLFAAAANQEATVTPSGDPMVDGDARRYSVMSPNEDDIGAQSPSNEHIERLAAILLTYNFLEKDLGQSVLTRA
jgi:TBC1 domain family member 15